MIFPIPALEVLDSSSASFDYHEPAGWKMQYYAKLSGKTEDLRCSGREQAKNAVLKHLIEAGAGSTGEVFTLDENEVKRHLFHGVYQNVPRLVLPLTKSV
jgi:hypothetical protein